MPDVPAAAFSFMERPSQLSIYVAHLYVSVNRRGLIHAAPIIDTAHAHPFPLHRALRGNLRVPPIASDCRLQVMLSKRGLPEFCYPTTTIGTKAMTTSQITAIGTSWHNRWTA